MAEETMPATEANEETLDERAVYELAFHVLPTVAEEEVEKVFGDLKNLIGTHTGEVTGEELPHSFTLAYPIRKLVDGRYQRFTESFFGWIRFALSPSELAKLTEEVRHQNTLLRFLMIRLDRAEIEQPFRVFEKRKAPVIVGNSEGDEQPAESEAVLEKELDESLEQLTAK